MARLRYNGVRATLGADLLTAGTTITFTSKLTHAAGDVPTISGSDYLPLYILDANGLPLEIVHLTAYTTGATTGTVTRAQESTTAADHASGLTVEHGLTVADATEFNTAPTFVGCRLYRSAAYTIPNGTLTPIPWDAENYDTHGFHSTTVNLPRITIPTGQGGYYHFGGTWGSTGSLATGARIVAFINVNGATVAGTEFPSGGFSCIHTATDIQVSAGDYVELAAYVNLASVGLNVSNSAFYCHKLG